MEVSVQAGLIDVAKEIVLAAISQKSKTEADEESKLSSDERAIKYSVLFQKTYENLSKTISRGRDGGTQ